MQTQRPWTMALAAAALLALPLAAAAPAAAEAPSSASTAPAVADDGVPAYLDAVYADLFGRSIDPSGEATWTAALRNGTPRRAVADAITASDEFRSGLIIGAYHDVLGREPDAAGLQYWLDRMRQGMTIQEMEAGFYGSDEHRNATGPRDGAWLEALYRDVLGRDGSYPETSQWQKRLPYEPPTTTIQVARWPGSQCPSDFGAAPEPCLTHAQVALAFLMSTERLSSDLDGDYQWLLGRGLDQSGARTWVGQLQSGTRYEAVIGSIIASPEYWLRATGG